MNIPFFPYMNRIGGRVARQSRAVVWWTGRVCRRGFLCFVGLLILGLVFALALLAPSSWGGPAHAQEPTATPAPTETATETPTEAPIETPAPTSTEAATPTATTSSTETPLPPETPPTDTATPTSTATYTPTPTPTPPPCPVRDALRGNPQGIAAYQTLRDEVLAHSVAGRRYTALYEKHAPEVARILAADPMLAARAAALLRQWQPAVKGLVAMERGGEPGRHTVQGDR